VVVIVLMGALAAACSTPAHESVDGVVVEVISPSSIVEWDSLTLRSDEGKEFQFLRGDGVDLRYWRASHLREHMQRGDRVTVTYQKERGRLVAQAIEHREPPTGP
jgi:hypothetical protein